MFDYEQSIRFQSFALSFNNRNCEAKSHWEFCLFELKMQVPICLIGILGMKTFSPVTHPVMLVASVTLDANDFTIIIVRLYNLGRSKFQ